MIVLCCRTTSFSNESQRRIDTCHTVGSLARWVRCFTALRDGAGLAAGDGTPRVYHVEPVGEFENDPNVTDKKFPGNPTRSYRSRKPLRVIAQVDDWTRLSPEALQGWPDRLAALRADQRDEIIN